MAYDEDGIWKPDDTGPEEVDYPDVPPEMMAQFNQKTAAPEQVDYPDMPPDMVAQFRQPAAAPEQVDYPDMPEAEAVKLGLKKEPTLREQAYPEGRRGFGERVAAGWEGGFGKEPLGLAPETQQRFPMIAPFQPLIAGIDATLRSVPGLAGAASGAAASVLESAPQYKYGLPDISPSIPGVTRLSRTAADRAQRDLKIIGEGALLEPMLGTAATRVPSVERPRAPWNPPPAAGIAEPPVHRPGVTPEGQYQFPVDAAHQPRLPMEGGRGRAPPRQLELPIEGDMRRGPELPLEGGEGTAPVRHGSPGSEAAAGTAEAQPPPPGSKARGPEDWGKKIEPSAPGEATGINVGEIDPTLRQVLTPEQPVPKQLPPAEVPAGTMELPPVEVKPPGAEVPPVEVRPAAAAEPPPVREVRPEPAAPAVAIEHDPMDMARRGELSAARAEELAKHYQNRDKQVVDAVLGKDADAWRKAHKLSDKYWESGYNDAKARVQDKLVEALEAKHPPETIEAMYRKLEQSEHTDPQGWRDFARDLRDVEGSRENAVTTVGYTLRRLPEAGKALGQIDRETLAVIQHALDREAKRGGNPDAFLRDAFAKSSERYGGGADAAEIIAGDMARLKELMRNPPQERAVPALPAPKPVEIKSARPPKAAEAIAKPTVGTLLKDQRGGARLPPAVESFLRDERGGGRITRKPVAPAVAKAQDAILDRIAPDPGILDKLPGSRSEARRSLMSFYQAAKDQLHPLRETERLGPKLSADESFYEAARKSKGLAARVEQELERGTYNIKTREVNGKPLREAIKGVENDAGFDAYVMAKRALNYEQRGKKSGIPTPEANLVVSQTKKLYDQNFKELISFGDRGLDNLQRSGLYSAEDVARMRALNPEHIPFNRLLDKNSGLGQQLGVGLQVNPPLRSITKGGSEQPIIHYMDSIIKNRMVQLDAAEKNLVMQKVDDWIRKYDPNGKYFTREHNIRATEVSAAEMNKFMKEHGIADELHDAMTIYRSDFFRPSEDTFRLRRDGKDIVYRINDEAPAALGKAISAMDQDTVGMLTKIASFPAKTLRAGATSTLEFMLKNVGRDNISAFINTKGFRPGYDMISGAVSTFMKDSAYQRAAIEGGLNSTMVAMDRNKALKMHPKDFIGQVTHVINPKNWLSVLQDISEFSENATRMGMYKRAIAQGKTPAEAAFIMREGTLDFQRIGGNQQVKAFNMITPFFNVSLEGLDRTARAFKDNPVATSLKVAASITLPSMLLWDHNKDDPRYQEMEWWRKDLFWNFFTDKWVNMSAEDAGRIEPALKRQAPDGSWQRNDGIIWSFPKPFEVGIIFGSVPERVADYLYRKDPKAFKDIGKTIWEGFTPSFIPQAVVPIAEQWGNRSLFRDRDLVPEYMKKLSPEEQYGTKTSEVAKWAGKQLSAFLPKGSSFGSPMVLDNYVQGYAGGLGKYVLDAMDKGLEMTGVVKPGVKPAATEADIYGLRAFVARSPGAGAQSIQNFYDIWADRKTSKADVSHMRRSGRPEEALAERRENAALQVAEGTHKQIGFLHERIRRVMRDPDMTPEAKREKIDVAYLQMISAARYGINKFNVRKEQLERAQ